MLWEWDGHQLTGDTELVIADPLPLSWSVFDGRQTRETTWHANGLIVHTHTLHLGEWDSTVPEWQENRRKFFTTTSPREAT